MGSRNLLLGGCRAPPRALSGALLLPEPPPAATSTCCAATLSYTAAAATAAAADTGGGTGILVGGAPLGESLLGVASTPGSVLAGNGGAVSTTMGVSPTLWVPCDALVRCRAEASEKSGGRRGPISLGTGWSCTR